MLTLAHRLGHAETTYRGSTVSARIDLPAATEQPGTLSYDARDLLRAAARGEFIGLPVVLRGWMDLSEKTLLVSVGALCDTSVNLLVAGRGSRAAPARVRGAWVLGPLRPAG